MKNRWFNFLKYGHAVSNCRLARTCNKCGKRHQWAVCKKGSKEAAGERNDGDKNDGEDRGSVTTTTSAKSSSSVLMQTAYVCGKEKSKKVKINILFDNGSQRGYVTEKLKKKIRS